MTAIERARELLGKSGSLAVVNGDREYSSSARGIRPLTDLLSSNREMLRGASVADKIVGKAAALLMAAGGVKEVYAGTIGRAAANVFERFGIKFSYGNVTEHIKNRAGNGMCPMEQTVRYVDDPADAEIAIRRTQKVLAARAERGEKMKKLGFGMMRLPVKGGQNDIDLEQVNEMVDTFLQRGFEYFDTAWMYHEHMSEIAVRECLVKRYPRESFKLATKLPAFMLKSADEMMPTFEKQCEKCGVDYFDYYLIHNINAENYRNQVQKFDAFGFVKKLKEQGRIRHYGFSFHDTADVLDKILCDHPDAEFVQLQINYLDWDSDRVQSGKCWEVARKHGKPVIVMEPVKGGTLAKVPAQAEGLLKAVHPDMSVPSWAVRFAAGLDGVFMVLSGMSDIGQLKDNTSFMSDFKPLDENELQTVKKAASVIKGTGAIACTACRYCTENCPTDIPIPDYFGLYNSGILAGKPQDKAGYEEIAAGHGRASDCVKCGACEGHCPQHLEIRSLLEKIAEKYE